jgi:hypothetical protein
MDVKCQMSNDNKLILATSVHNIVYMSNLFLFGFRRPLPIGFWRPLPPPPIGIGESDLNNSAAHAQILVTISIILEGCVILADWPKQILGCHVRFL